MRTSMSHFLPKTAVITQVKTLTDKEKLFTLTLEKGDSLNHRPGQFVMVSLFGIGEAPISISSSPLRQENSFDLCIRSVGSLTGKVHKLAVNDRIGVRGPYGNGFPLDRITGKDIIFVAGGLGIAPLRSLIQYVFQKRKEYRRIAILYGAKRPGDILFSEEVYTWVEDDSIDMHITVDVADSSWHRHVGVLPHLFQLINIDPLNSVAFIVGPPVMYRFVIMEALANGVFESNIFMSLERRMRCGLGKCGHCQINGVYVCQDGPVFSYKDAKKLKEAL